MKKIILVCLLVIGLFTINACGGKKKTATISVKVDGNLHISSVKEGDILEYELLGEKYKIEIIEIEDEELTVKPYGLVSPQNLEETNKKHVIKKGAKLELQTPTDDDFETIVINY